MRTWNAIGGMASLALGRWLFTIDVPAPIWWAPWMLCAGGAILLASAGLRALLDRRR